MKQRFKRAAALLMAFAMCLSLIGGAYALEEAEASEETYSAAQEEAEVLPEAEESSVERVSDSSAVENQAEEPEAEAEESAENKAPEEGAEPDTSVERDTSDESSASVSTAAAKTTTDPDEGKNFIQQTDLYLKLNGKLSLKLKNKPSAGAYFVSSNSKVVSVNKSTGVLKGIAPGRAKIELRKANGTKLDQVVVFCFRPTTWTRDTKKNTRANPSVLTVKNSAHPGYSNRKYKLVCQQKQKDKPYGTYLASHGCSVCSVAAVCQAYGVSEMTVDWLMTGGLEEIAARENVALNEDKTLGYYGLQKILEYGGISTKIYTKWGKNVDAAAEEMVKCLSEGRPILMFVDSREWNGITLCAAPHCVVLAGISPEGYLQIINSSYPNVVSCFYQRSKSKCQVINLTVKELLANFTRAGSKKAVRRKNDDFYLTLGGGSGLQTFLELNCDYSKKTPRATIATMKATLDKTSYIYTGEAFTPQVKISGLKKDQDFRVKYSNNINAGKAAVTVFGIGDYVGRLNAAFTIKPQAGEIIAENKTITTSAKEQKIQLGASAKGDAPIQYKSNNRKVKVNSSGVVTVPKNFVGKVTLTLTAAKTTNYTKATKKVVLAVNPMSVKLSGVANVKGRKLKAAWKSIGGVTGYQVQYWKKDQAAKAKVVNVKGSNKNVALISKLSVKATYYVRVRTYKRVSGKNYYSAWSNVKAAAIKV